MLGPPQNLALPVVAVLAVALIGWYLAGNELMRRRGRSLAVWSKRALDPLGGRQAVQWLTTHSFRLEVEGLRPPFRAGSLTGLTESWDVPMTWLLNRLNGRRDMVLLQVSLHQQPLYGLELYRPRSVLAGDARRYAGDEGWQETAVDGLRLASPLGDGALGLARELLAALGPEAAQLVRLAIRRRGLNLTLALNVPDRRRLAPDDFRQLVERLAQVIRRVSTPAPGQSD